MWLFEKRTPSFSRNSAFIQRAPNSNLQQSQRRSNKFKTKIFPLTPNNKRSAVKPPPLPLTLAVFRLALADVELLLGALLGDLVGDAGRNERVHEGGLHGACECACVRVRARERVHVCEKSEHETTTTTTNNMCT